MRVDNGKDLLYIYLDWDVAKLELKYFAKRRNMITL